MRHINALGDLEITDPAAMRVLADPVRLTLLERLQRHGPATTNELSTHGGTTTAATGEHLRRLAEFGLVEEDEDGDDRWRAVASGIRFEPSDEAESQAAYQALSNQMFMRLDQLPRRWMAEDEPRLEAEWRKVSGIANARMKLTSEEVESLDAQMEALLVPYLTRDAADVPAGARPVRLLRYLLPEADSEEAVS